MNMQDNSISLNCLVIDNYKNVYIVNEMNDYSCKLILAYLSEPTQLLNEFELGDNTVKRLNIRSPQARAMLNISRHVVSTLTNEYKGILYSQTHHEQVMRRIRSAISGINYQIKKLQIEGYWPDKIEDLNSKLTYYREEMKDALKRKYKNNEY